MIERTMFTERAVEGRVAQILSPRELVINVGATAGVKPGMKFRVLAEKPIQIIDPETSEVLDTIDREKVRVMATEVRPRITICKTYRRIKTGGGPLWGRISTLLSTDQIVNPPRDVPETLKSQDAALPQPLSFDEEYVKVNDRVVESSGEDEPLA